MYNQWMYGPNTEIYKNNTVIEKMNSIAIELS